MENSWEKSFNSVRPLQRRSRKCISQSEAMAAIMFFRSAGKHKLSKRRIKSCFLPSFVEFHSLIELNIFYFNFSMGTYWFQRRRKCLSQSEARVAILFYQSARKKHRLGRGHWDLASCNNSRKSWSNASKVELVLHQDKYLYKTASKYIKGRLRNVRKPKTEWTDTEWTDKEMDWQTEWNLKPPPPQFYLYGTFIYNTDKEICISLMGFGIIEKPCGWGFCTEREGKSWGWRHQRPAKKCIYRQHTFKYCKLSSFLLRLCK